MTLVAGYFIGEFGYELFRWHAYVRYISKDYTKTIVACRPGNELLYQDFATDFIAIPEELVGISTNAGDGRHCGVNIDLESLSQQVFQGIPYMRMVCPEQKVVDSDPQIFIPYGDPACKLGYDVVIHARNINVDEGVMLDKHKTQKESRNWDYSRWVTCVDKLLPTGSTMACIGTSDAAYHIPGTMDLRGESLGRLADVLASSKLIVGPSSGPMHFASLCECPQVTWGEAHLEERYRRVWNPLGTPVDFITADQYDPDPEDIVGRVDNMLSILEGE